MSDADDAERLEASIQSLAAAVREALEKRINLADHRQRRKLEEAFDAYAELVSELHGADDPDSGDLA